MSTRPRIPKKKKEIPSMQFTDRDREILMLIYQYRFIPSTLLQYLLHTSQRVIQKRLHKLRHHNYVTPIIISRNEPYLYALGNRGADELLLHYSIDRGYVNWTTKNREAKTRYIDHTLMIGSNEY